MKKIIFINLIFILLALTFVDLSYSASLTVTFGTYDTSVVKGSQITVPVTVQLSGGSGSDNVNLKLVPVTGLSCSSNQKTLTFSSDGSQQTTFQVSADSSGTYSNPFTATATLSTTTASETATDTIKVSEPVSWEVSFDADKTSDISQNDEIVLTATVSVSSGTLEGVTADLSYPSELSLISGADPYTMGDISGTGVVTWTVKAGSFSSAVTPSVNIVSTNPSDSKSKTVSLSPTTTSSSTTSSSTTTTNSGSSGSGGVGGSSLNSTNTVKTVTIEENTLQKDKFVDIKIEDSSMPVEIIKIMSNKTNSSIKLEVSSLNTIPSTIKKISKKVYKYIKVIKYLLPDKNLKQAKIRFKVSKKWMSDNSATRDDIVLFRYHNNQWNKLNTVYVNDDANYYYFEATTPGFSYFAIGVDKETTSTSSTTTTITTSTTLKQNNNSGNSNNNASGSTQETSTTTTTTIKVSNSSSSKVVFGIIGIVLILVVILLYYKKNHQWDI